MLLMAIMSCLPCTDVLVPPAEWLDRTMHLESSGNRWAVGDYRNGVPRSRGAFQVQRKPWIAFGGKQPWEKWAHNPAESRKVASRILAACKRYCERKGRPVNFSEIRRAYRFGGY